jgi:hypothetical protein
VQNHGTGLISQGTADWADYRVTADVTIFLAKQAGIAARVGGMRRWYALLLCDDGTARLVKDRERITTLSEQPFDVQLDRAYRLSLTVSGNHLTGEIDGQQVADVIDEEDPLTAGAAALIVTEGTLSSGPVRVEALG